MQTRLILKRAAAPVDSGDRQKAEVLGGTAGKRVPLPSLIDRSSVADPAYSQLSVIGRADYSGPSGFMPASLTVPERPRFVRLGRKFVCMEYRN